MWEVEKRMDDLKNGYVFIVDEDGTTICRIHGEDLAKHIVECHNEEVERALEHE